jgi:hypothetical protein
VLTNCWDVAHGAFVIAALPGQLAAELADVLEILRVLSAAHHMIWDVRPVAAGSGMTVPRSCLSSSGTVTGISSSTRDCLQCTATVGSRWRVT